VSSLLPYVKHRLRVGIAATAMSKLVLNIPLPNNPIKFLPLRALTLKKHEWAHIMTPSLWNRTSEEKIYVFLTQTWSNNFNSKSNSESWEFNNPNPAQSHNPITVTSSDGVSRLGLALEIYFCETRTRNLNLFLRDSNFLSGYWFMKLWGGQPFSFEIYW